MSRSNVPSRPRASLQLWPRAAVLTLVGVTVASCSNSGRFDSNPYAARNSAPQQQQEVHRLDRAAFGSRQPRRKRSRCRRRAVLRPLRRTAVMPAARKASAPTGRARSRRLIRRAPMSPVRCARRLRLSRNRRALGPGTAARRSPSAMAKAPKPSRAATACRSRPCWKPTVFPTRRRSSPASVSSFRVTFRRRPRRMCRRRPRKRRHRCRLRSRPTCISCSLAKASPASPVSAASPLPCWRAPTTSSLTPRSPPAIA